MLDRNNEEGLLSHYYSKKLIKNRKLNLFGKAITTIDLIAIDNQQVHTIVELDLSHNAIRQLGIISQFRELQVLNISNNNIEQYTQLQKLTLLPHLHTLYFKNNPVLKHKPSALNLQFLTSLNTDLVIVGGEIEQKIVRLISQTQLFHRYSHYNHKIKVHGELLGGKALTNNTTDYNCNSLPKIKRLFEHDALRDKTLRKSIVGHLNIALFEKPEDLLVELQKLYKTAKKNVSQIINQINQSLSQIGSKKFQKIQSSKILKRGKITSQIHQIVQSSNMPLRQKQNIKHPISHSKLSPNRSSSLQMSYVRKERSTYDCDMQWSTIKISDIQNQLTNILAKKHPSFQLLHSPLSSLKSHEKDLLIEQLLNTLKESMKSNIRIKCLQLQNNELKEQIKQLKKHLADLTIEVNQHSQHQDEKIRELQQNYEQQLSRAQLLEMQSKRRLLENELQRQMIDKFKEQTKVKSTQNQSLLKDIQLYESISQLRSNSIRKRHLHILMQKAQHYSQLQKLRSLNRNVHCTLLKQQALYSLKLNLFLNHCHLQLKNKIKQKHMKSLLSKNHQLFEIKQSQKQLMCSLKLWRVKSFLQLLKLRRKEQMSIKQKIQAVSHKHKSQKIAYFVKSISKSITSKCLQKHQRQAVKYRTAFLTQAVFSSWYNYIKFMKEQQQNYQKAVNLKMKLGGIKDFVSTMSYENSLKSKTIALYNFLPSIRKIRACFTLIKKISHRLLQRQINVNKIKLQKKHTYFQFFISVMKDRIIKRGLKQQRQKALKKLQEKEQEKNLQSIVQKRKQMKIKFAKNMAFMAHNLRIKILRRNISSSTLQLKLSQMVMGRFVSKIRTFYIQQLRTKNKLAQIEKYRYDMLRCRRFFAVLGRIKQLKSTQTKKLRMLRMKVFYNWKIIFNQHRLIIFREKYYQLQKQVEILKQKQLKNQEEREILFRKIDEKQQLYHQCLKKSEELTFLLESKEIKYQNLKNIYNATLQTNQYYKQKSQPIEEQLPTAKIVASKSKFLKCMQQQIRKDLSIEAQKLQTHKDRFLYQKDRNLQFKQKLFNNQYHFQVPQKTQRFSFVSSFKRF